MSKSAAERQRAYRQRRALAGDNGERRLSTWLPTGAALALGRLARHRGVSQRQALEQIIAQAETEALATLNDAELESYLHPPSVTR
ncbi:hypothetical protein [Immundisolibacter sp.]|jgi:hypothetical protein|uniref:hypothetical protein n=1 Tax=Immundisolibacter sp. TaxID=1934948 RepID=UPI0026326697|nr:hypothetical protein [Immundisolibacter sp.]MDD3651191.1 hypothetical protein [Immundisolibacter sp.]